MIKKSVIALLLLLLPASQACQSVRRQKALAPVPDSALFHNLQVLPQNLTREQLIETMRGFTTALNVHCDHCHLSTGEDEFDFISDAKPAKATARAMLRMTHAINAETILKVNPQARPVACMTCHRGNAIPEPAAAPPKS